MSERRYWEQQQPYYGGRGGHSPVTALVLGILGLVVCSIFAPFAWYIGSQAYQDTGDGMARAGQILGIIGTVLLAIGLLAAIVILGSTDSSTGT